MRLGRGEERGRREGAVSVLEILHDSMMLLHHQVSSFPSPLELLLATHWSLHVVREGSRNKGRRYIGGREGGREGVGEGGRERKREERTG